MKSHKNEFCVLTSVLLVVQSWWEKTRQGHQEWCFSEYFRAEQEALPHNLFKHVHTCKRTAWTQRSGRDLRPALVLLGCLWDLRKEQRLLLSWEQRADTTISAQGGSRDRHNVTASNSRQSPAGSGGTQQHTMPRTLFLRQGTWESQSGEGGTTFLCDSRGASWGRSCHLPGANCFAMNYERWIMPWQYGKNSTNRMGKQRQWQYL